MQHPTLADKPEGKAGQQPAPGTVHGAYPSASQAVVLILLSDEQARALIGVGSRTWADLVATADWLPVPIALGPRLRKWHRDELIEALRTRAPRGSRGAEPAQLLRARIEKLKAAAPTAQA